MICVCPTFLRLWCLGTCGVWSVQQGGHRAELVITEEGTALSALTGGALKLRKHSFRLSLMHWCASPVSKARVSARSWLSLCWHLAHTAPVAPALVLLSWVTSPNQLTRCLHKL